MSRLISFIVCLAGSLSVGVLQAQTAVYPLPGATVGTPYSFDFFGGTSLIYHVASAGFPSGSYSFQLSAGSTFPPGLNVTSSAISGTPAEAGVYTFSLDFLFNYMSNGMAFSEGQSVPLSINVAANPGAQVAVNPDILSFTASFSSSQGSTSVGGQSIVITNRGNSEQSFTATPNSSPDLMGGSWLSVSPETGTVAPFSTTSVAVAADPSFLGLGTYLGTVSIVFSPNNQQLDVSVIAGIGAGEAQEQVSQTGLRFQTVAGGANPPAQSIVVLDSGAPFSIATSASTTSGGQWLSAAPSSNAVTFSSPASVEVGINSQPLKAGDYYGQIQISSDGAANSPQTATVVLNVAPAGTDLGAFVYPTGLIFVGKAGDTAPAAQTISVTSPSSSAPGVFVAETFGHANSRFTVQPTSATVNAASPVTITVQPIAGLAAGIYLDDIQLLFPNDGVNGSSRQIAVLLVILPAASNRTLQAAAASASSCTPTKLLPVFTQLGANFATVAAWPTPVEVTIVDDCGNFLTTGNVTASFSDGDPSLPLTSLNDGRWSATWQPLSSSAQVVITVDAAESMPLLQGTQTIGGALQTNPTTPSVNPGGVVSAAKYAQNQPLAPGGFTSIYGVHLSAGQNPALSLPLATQLGATQVFLGGRALPLQYATDGQVNAVLPYDIPANTTQQLIISNGPALSVPQPIVIAPAQPAVFAQSDGSGVVFDVKPGQTAQVLVDANHPMSAGDAIVIYCAGLGPVTPAIAAGSAAPSSPPANTTNPVTVTIGGKPANVFFGGLVGGFAGLYQVNAYVPKGITPSDTVPLIVTAAGFASAPVTVAVK